MTLAKFKNAILVAIASVALLVPAAMLSTTLAGAEGVNINENLCAGAEFNATTGSCASASGAGSDINNLIATAINIFSLVVGVIAVVMIIVGGVKYITSGCDSGNVTGAKNTILYAVIGLVIVAIAQIIVQFVLEEVTTNVGT